MGETHKRARGSRTVPHEHDEDLKSRRPFDVKFCEFICGRIAQLKHATDSDFTKLESENSFHKDVRVAKMVVFCGELHQTYQAVARNTGTMWSSCASEIQVAEDEAVV